MTKMTLEIAESLELDRTCNEGVMGVLRLAGDMEGVVCVFLDATFDPNDPDRKAGARTKNGKTIPCTEGAKIGRYYDGNDHGMTVIPEGGLEGGGVTLEAKLIHWPVRAPKAAKPEASRRRELTGVVRAR